MKPKLIFVFSNSEFSSEICYTFKTLASVLDVEYKFMKYSKLPRSSKSLVISYGKKKPNIKASNIHIFESGFLGKDYKKPASMPLLPLDKWNDLPVIYCSDKGERYKRIDNAIETNIDIIASSFFMLSRYEELIIKDRDHYNRFPAKSSVAYKEEFLTRPIVDEYIELILKWSKLLGKNISRRKSKHGIFEVCLSHDVDVLKRPLLRRSLFAVIQFIKLKPKKAYLIVCEIAQSISDVNKSVIDRFFKYIIRQEKNYCFNSTFFFLSSKDTQKRKFRINDKQLQNIFNYLEENSCEVGHHGNFKSSYQFSEFKKEITWLKRFGIEPIGTRQHYLKYQIDKTPAIQEQNNIRYDTTLGYADHEGFRSGFAHPHYLYNFSKKCKYDVLEIPLVIMDGTLDNYRYLSPKDGYRSSKKILNLVKKYRGCVSILWHPHYLLKYDSTGGYAKIYWKLLSWIKRNKGQGLSGKETYYKHKDLYDKL